MTRSIRASRFLWIVLGGAVLIAAVVWIVLRRSAADTDDTPPHRVSSKPSSMSDMPGMNMSKDGSVRLTASDVSEFGVIWEIRVSSTAIVTGALT